MVWWHNVGKISHSLTLDVEQRGHTLRKIEAVVLTAVEGSDRGGGFCYLPPSWMKMSSAVHSH